MCFLFSVLIKIASLFFLLLISLFSFITGCFLLFLLFLVLSEFFFVKFPEASPLSFHQGIEDDRQQASRYEVKQGWLPVLKDKHDSNRGDNGKQVADEAPDEVVLRNGRGLPADHLADF